MRVRRKHRKLAQYYSARIRNLEVSLSLWHLSQRVPVLVRTIAGFLRVYLPEFYPHFVCSGISVSFSHSFEEHLCCHCTCYPWRMCACPDTLFYVASRRDTTLG